ncbi:MAG TPA: VanZ family protein [Egibacteraceae bacterium]|nr:VanZ family protein [Actinomycetota bacterium]HWB72488.1 VanZ family protein [Egibacteraceae bacterium]
MQGEQRRQPRPTGRGLLGDLWPALAIAALIFVLSSLPLRAPQAAPGWSDTAAHMTLFGALCVALRWAWLRRRWALAALGPVALTVCYGVLDEAHQAFVPGRSPDWRDVAADGVGALVALLLTVRTGRMGAGGARRKAPGRFPA